MPDLTNIKGDYIIVKPDAKTKTAFDAWKDKLTPTEKAEFEVDATGKLIISPPDPLGTFDAKRKEFIKLVDDNAETMTDIVRLRFEVDSPTFSAIIQKVAKPAELND